MSAPHATLSVQPSVADSADPTIGQVDYAVQFHSFLQEIGLTLFITQVGPLVNPWILGTNFGQDFAPVGRSAELG